MEKIEVLGSTVDFYKFVENGLTSYQFDTSKCGPPEPMVNAMAGLEILDEKSQLIMINHKTPAMLLPKIEKDFNYKIENLEDGRVKVVFTKKTYSKGFTNFKNNSCAG